MPNLINRRKKKNKVPEVVNEQSDSDSSCSYEFSSKLNSKHHVIPDESRSIISKDDKEECKSIRFEIGRCLHFFANYAIMNFH